MNLLIPDLLIPKKHIDLNKWTVIACDQFTKNDLYWKNLYKKNQNAISTLNLVIPEYKLSNSNPLKLKLELDNIAHNSNSYSKMDVFEAIKNSFVIVSRRFRGKRRNGILLMIDLEDYSSQYSKDYLVRATENLIENRMLLRKKIRSLSHFELSHVILLYDDDKTDFLKEILKNDNFLSTLYSLQLEDGSFLDGYVYKDVNNVKRYFNNLFNDNIMNKFFLVGDGNHSLASAKAHWEEFKTTLNKAERLNHPLRYHIVEAINVNDQGLEIHPINRMIKFSRRSKLNLLVFLRETFNLSDFEDHEQIIDLSKVSEPLLAYRSVDLFLAGIKNKEVNYPHSLDEVRPLLKDKSYTFLLMPSIQKHEIFGMMNESNCNLPQKSFSIGLAQDKRFYLEIRKIKF